ncbi:MAG: AAA family ATPase, partial [Planctomycetaceae bacterium]|nr:AAA family ATPase [Planctomycetaceae bacterium]
MKNLPIGIQSFEDLRSNNYLYVDKTEIIHRMISTGKCYFLSRPRRFGKSLLVSTMEAIFKGRKELFDGLYIYDKWDWSQNYPVIRIDWTRINLSTVDKMEISLCRYLRSIAQRYKITLLGETVSDCFDELIMLLYEQTGEKVVVLIDEYDKPITSHLFDSQLDIIRKTVHDFYQVLKGSDEYLRFIFLTGVSKFSGLSIFSALNNLNDITLHKQFVSICGYTQEELENNFPEYIDSVADYLNMTKEKVLEQIRYWYNGYTWDGKTAIYNPFSTLMFFYAQHFNDYWFNTGTPTFLIDIIQRRNRTNTILEPFVVSDNIFKGYSLPDIEETPLLFQTGYLTIRHKELIDGIPRYTLGVPNSEVNKAFLTCLLEAYGKYPIEQ